MSKLRNKLKQLTKALTIVERYNRHYIMGADEDIKYLKQRVLDLEYVPTEKLEEELKWCIDMVESYYNVIPPDFIKQYNRYLEEMEKELYQEF